MNRDNIIPDIPEQEGTPSVLDLLVAQYEGSQDENSFLNKLLFHQIYQKLRAVDPENCDRIITLVCALCGEYGRSRYIAGLKQGAQLIAQLIL